MEHPTLDQELATIRTRADERWPEDRKARNEQYIAEIERTTAAHALAIGETAPDFDLPVAGSAGGRVQLAGALKRGVVVISFYRGQW